MPEAHTPSHKVVLAELVAAQDAHAAACKAWAAKNPPAPFGDPRIAFTNIGELKINAAPEVDAAVLRCRAAWAAARASLAAPAVVVPSVGEPLAEPVAPFMWHGSCAVWLRDQTTDRKEVAEQWARDAAWAKVPITITPLYAAPAAATALLLVDSADSADSGVGASASPTGPVALRAEPSGLGASHSVPGAELRSIEQLRRAAIAGLGEDWAGMLDDSALLGCYADATDRGITLFAEDVAVARAALFVATGSNLLSGNNKKKSLEDAPTLYGLLCRANNLLIGSPAYRARDGSATAARPEGARSEGRQPGDACGTRPTPPGTPQGAQQK